MDMIGDWKSADLGDKARNELRKKFHNDNNRDNDSFDDKFIKALNDDDAWNKLKEMKEMPLFWDGKKFPKVEDWIENDALNIPSGVQTVSKDLLFYKGAGVPMSFIRKVFIPSTVTFIGKDAFKSCNYLEEVIFEDINSEVTIQKGAFSGCCSLKKINFPRYTQFAVSGGEFTSILAGTAVEQIDFYDTFRFCHSLYGKELSDESKESRIQYIISEGITGEVIPQNLKINFMTNTIPEGMFKNSHLGDFQNWNNVDKIQEVGDYAFFVDESKDQSCFVSKNENGDVINIIPPNVRKIGKNAYRNRELPANIKLPKTLEEIGEGAFINTKIKLISCTSWQAKVLRANQAIDDDVEIQIDDESSLKQETLEKRIAVNPRMNNIVITCDDINVKDKRVVAIRLECDDPNMIASISKINGNDIHINILSVAEQSVEVEIKIDITYCE